MKRTDSQARFTIYDTTEPEPVPVGTCELVIQHRWRNAEFSILLGSGHRAKGIGTRRQSGYWLGQSCDEILMDAIKDDFRELSTVRTMAGQD